MTQQKSDLRPICLKQLWLVRVPKIEGGPGPITIEGGASYHLSEAHRASYVSEVAGRSAGPGEELEEPVGSPVPVHVREAFYKELVAAGGTIRVG